MTKTETLLREIVLKQDEYIAKCDYILGKYETSNIALNKIRFELSALKASLEEEEKKKLYPGVWYM